MVVSQDIELCNQFLLGHTIFLARLAGIILMTCKIQHTEMGRFHLSKRTVYSYTVAILFLNITCKIQNIFFQKMCQSYKPEEQKRIVMDLDVLLKSHDCPYIVACLGAYISKVYHVAFLVT